MAAWHGAAQRFGAANRGWRFIVLTAVVIRLTVALEFTAQCETRSAKACASSHPAGDFRLKVYVLKDAGTWLLS